MNKKPVTYEAKREALRLRIEERMSTIEIARRVGISCESAYKVLANNPLKPNGIGARTIGPEWLDSEVAALWESYATMSQKEVMEKIPNRSWTAISAHAAKLKIKRKWRWLNLRSSSLHPLLERLREVRESKGILQSQLAVKAGYGKTQVGQWEAGRSTPNIVSVCDWAEALGYELVLQPKAMAAVIPFPSKQKMMAGR